MSENPKIIICDCDHNNVDIEKAVFEKEGFDYKWLQCVTQDEVIEKCQGAVAFLNQYVKMDAKIFEAIPTLKFIVRYGVGVDNVNLADATKYGVQVCNVPDYGMNEVADQAMALMLSVVRKVTLLERKTLAGDWDYAKAIPVHRLSELTVGVIGTGRIGREFIKRVKAFNMKVIAFDPWVKEEDKVEDITYVAQIDDIWANADVISLHCSLNETNQHLLNDETFAKMKDGVFIVNVSRGGLIDEAALDRALTSGKVAGAGLDVFGKEPIDRSNPLLKQENCLITPHMAWYSAEAANELKRKCAEEACKFMKGEALRYPVNQL